MGEYLLGSIMWVAFAWAPQGTTLADGHCMAINQNQALYALVGNTYGGDPRTNFCLPDLRPKGADGKPAQDWNGGPRAVIVTNGIFPSRP